jgi:hypothetical protein
MIILHSCSNVPRICSYKAASYVRTCWRRDKLSPSRDWISLDVVAALKLFAVGRGDKGDGHAVAATVTIGAGPAKNKIYNL